MRLPGRESTAVRLRFAVGISADRASRTTCAATSALSLPTVIWGLFRSAIASASGIVNTLLPLADDGFVPGCFDVCAPAEVARTQKRASAVPVRVMSSPPSLLPRDAPVRTPPAPGTRLPLPTPAARQ